MLGHARGLDVARVGGTVLLAAASFTALFLYSTNRALGADRSTLYVRLDAADGLQKGDAVLLRGVNVGEVKALDFVHDDVIVRIRLSRSVPVSAGVRAEMVAADVFGRQNIVLHDDAGHAERLADGDTIAGRGPVTLTARFDQIGRNADRLLADTTIELIRATLAGAHELADRAASAVAGIDTAAAGAWSFIARQGPALDTLSSEAVRLVRDLRTSAGELDVPALRRRFDSLTTSLASTTGNLDAAAILMTSLLGRIESGTGSAGLLVADTMLYARATGALGALERLLDDIRENPKRYLTIKVF